MNLSDLVRDAFAIPQTKQSNRSTAMLFDELVRMARSKARSFPRLDPHVADDVAADTLLKLRDDRTGRIAEMLDDPDPSNRERRVRAWIGRTIKNRLIDRHREATNKLGDRASLDPITGRLHGANHDEHGAADADATHQEPSQEDAIEAAENQRHIDAMLGELDALIARTRDSHQRRYREGFAADARDLLEIAHDRATMADIVAARGRNPADRTAYNTVNRGLSRVRERLLHQLETELAADEIPLDLAERLSRIVRTFLLLRGAGTK